MTLADLSPLANHLWQSSVFAVAAWLLTLALRKNRASVRYWVWFTASVKFLIPFSLFVAIGNKFAWHSSPTITQPLFAGAINQISQPFATFTEPSTAIPPIHVSISLPIILLATWICGAIVVLVFWLRSLQQIRAIKRTASPLPLSLPIPVMSSPARMEPGVFGIFNPVLILPEGITDRLTQAQLNSVIAHELCHVRRKDNLTAAIHMVVETVFWFHPFVWWIQTRLVAERERTCDESVVVTSNDPQIYAEAIVSVCKIYIESPLRCVSGVTGSDLKKRIRRIVKGRIGGELTFARKVTLAIVGIAAINLPIFAGMIGAQSNPQTAAAEYKSEVVSVKPSEPDICYGRRQFCRPTETPDGFHAVTSARMLIEMAFGAFTENQLLGAPAWTNNSEAYEIDARMDRATADAIQKLSPDARKLARQHMLQVVLAEHFKLVVHRETKELPVYSLFVGKNGTKLQQSSADFRLPNGEKPPAFMPGGFSISDQGSGTDLALGVGVTMDELVWECSAATGQPIVDKTGLTGKYDFTVRFAVNDSQQSLQSPNRDPLVVTALQSLGFRVESGKGPVEVIIIDHVERL